MFVHEKREQRKPSGKALASLPDRIVIVGGGAAGFAAAEMLRRREFRGSIVMLSSDAAAPIDRPNLSKDYLAGSAPEDLDAAASGQLLQRNRHRIVPQ